MSPGSLPADRNGFLEAVRRRRWRLLIGGELVDGAATFVKDNPATETELATVPDADAGQVGDAVAAAEAAQPAWAARTGRERAAVVRSIAAVLREHADELGMLDAADAGNPVVPMRGDVALGANYLEMFADWAMHLGGETVPASASHLHYTRREPYGVVARITPFNHPVLFAAQKIAAPLVAGNAVVLKPSEQAPLSALRIGELLTGLVPAGIVSVLSGASVETGRALVRHPAVRRIGFIGSDATGRAIQREAADAGVKDVTLELGGKNALVVCQDADLDAAADAAVTGMNFCWQGQSCGSTSRLLVHESVAEKVLARVVERVTGIRVGDPLAPDVDMGAMSGRYQYEKTLHYIDVARDEGAVLVAGGGRPAGIDPARGFFVEPTVFAGVRPSMRIAREEVFGPVLSVLTWRDDDEAVQIANSVDYGLTAGIWTRDITRAHRLAHRVEAGYVWVNDVATHYLGTPFGGYKSSGIGREESLEELLSYTQVKSVHVNLDG